MNKKLTRFFIVLFVIAVSVFATGFDIEQNDLYVAAFDNSGVCEVYLGGKPLGIEIGADGVIIADITPVVTEKGLVSPLQNSDVKCGDILVSVGGIRVSKPADITSALNRIKLATVELVIRRGDNTFTERVTVARDSLTGERRLGISARDNVSGIGTLTYVQTDGRFGALGHHITDATTGLSDAINTGKIFDCEITGVIHASDGKAGELSGIFNKNSIKIGTIDENCKYGIFGNYTGKTSGFSKIKTAPQSEIQHGGAYIYTCVDGFSPDYYTIDIIKTYAQNSPDTKSMVISVTDKRLIDKSGGIVQGMSGSPVIQNGKLIGAVTHVFVNDSTKGYAVYIDWMLHHSR